MMMTRRGFLKGMAGILATATAPAFVGSKILMPVREIIVPTFQHQRIAARYATIAVTGGAEELARFEYFDSKKGEMWVSRGRSDLGSRIELVKRA